MEIQSGQIVTAIRTIIYGPEGIGKSTFASGFPSPVFIDTEGSTNAMNISRFNADFSKWENILEAADEALKTEGIGTLVLDTVDWAEQACIRMLNERYKTDNILTLDYGKGSLYVVAEFEKLLAKLTKLIDKGVNVVLVAHAVMRKQELPDEMGAFDRWELKLQSKQVKAMVKEWGDMVLFANYKTLVIEDDKTKSKKAQGGKRVIYTQHRPTWDAKNRYGLDECIPFDYMEIAKIIEHKADKPKKKAEAKKETVKAEPKKEEAKAEEPKAEKPEAEAKSERPDIEELKKLMEQDKISENRLLYAIMTKTQDFTPTTLEGLDPQFVTEKLIGKWGGFVKYAKKFTENEVESMEIPY
jgi:hypothetical protein